MAQLKFWNGSSYEDIGSSGAHTHTEYVSKAGDTTTGNVTVNGTVVGNIWDGTWAGAQRTAVGTTHPALLLGKSDNSQDHIYLIAGSGGVIYLRPNNDTGQQAELATDGDFKVKGEIQSAELGAYGNMRAVHGNYGAMWRNDGNDLYLLFTASGDQYGSWNSARPFRANFATGDVYIMSGGGSRGIKIQGSNGYLASQGVYDNTTTGSPNVHINSGTYGYRFDRYTSSLKIKFDIREVNGNEVPEVPYDRQGKPATLAAMQAHGESLPDPDDLLDSAVISYRSDLWEEGSQHRMGVLVENLENTAPWVLNTERSAPDLAALSAGNLGLLQRLDTKIAALEARVDALEAA